MSDEIVVHDHAPGDSEPVVEVGGSFGTCEHCDTDAVVKVNGAAVCIPHMNEKFVGIGETVRQIAALVAALPEEEL